MKKSFLIFGALAAILSTNGYADIVISDTPDTTITVARAAKTKARITPQATDTPVTQENEDFWADDLDFASSSGSDIGMMACPYGCKLKCHKGKQVIHCVCKGEFGRPCDIIKSVTEAGDLK